MGLRAVLIVTLALAALSPTAVDGKAKAAGNKPDRKGDTAIDGLRRLEFGITGATCASCLIQIRHILKSAAGVAAAQVTLTGGAHAVVVYQSGKTTATALVDAVKQSGYGVVKVADAPYRTAPIGKIDEKSGATEDVFALPEMAKPKLSL